MEEEGAADGKRARASSGFDRPVRHRAASSVPPADDGRLSAKSPAPRREEDEGWEAATTDSTDDGRKHFVESVSVAPPFPRNGNFKSFEKSVHGWSKLYADPSIKNGVPLHLQGFALLRSMRAQKNLHLCLAVILSEDVVAHAVLALSIKASNGVSCSGTMSSDRMTAKHGCRFFCARIERSRANPWRSSGTPFLIDGSAYSLLHP
jgi:hypothetical protein